MAKFKRLRIGVDEGGASVASLFSRLTSDFDLAFEASAEPRATRIAMHSAVSALGAHLRLPVTSIEDLLATRPERLSAISEEEAQARLRVFVGEEARSYVLLAYENYEKRKLRSPSEKEPSVSAGLVVAYIEQLSFGREHPDVKSIWKSMNYQDRYNMVVSALNTAVKKGVLEKFQGLMTGTGKEVTMYSPPSTSGGGGQKRPEVAAPPVVPSGRGVDMKAMVNAANDWSYLMVRIQEECDSDRNLVFRISEASTKSQLDKWLMQRFGLSEIEARDVSNRAGNARPFETNSSGVTWIDRTRPAPRFASYPDLQRVRDDWVGTLPENKDDSDMGKLVEEAKRIFEVIKEKAKLDGQDPDAERFMRGWCGVASEMLYNKARDLGIPLELTAGYYGAPNVKHCWCTRPSGLIIDITARQFGGVGTKVYVGPIVHGYHPTLEGERAKEEIQKYAHVLAPQKRYVYALTVRPASPYTVPKGYSGFGNSPDYPHGTVIYPKLLPIDEVRHYSLLRLVTPVERYDYIRDYLVNLEYGVQSYFDEGMSEELYRMVVDQMHEDRIARNGISEEQVIAIAKDLLGKR